MLCSSSYLKRASKGMRSMSSRRPIGSGLKMRGSIGCVRRTIGLNAILPRMSRSMSMPGATSISSSPSFVSRNTQRSVMYSTSLPSCAAKGPENGRCSTSSTNLSSVPSRSIRNWPSTIDTSRQHVDRQRLALHRDVAVGVGGRAADDGHVDRHGLEEQVILAAHGDQLDQVFGGPLVQLAAAQARIDKGAQADPRGMARLAAGDVAKQVADRPQRQVVALDLVADDELLQRRGRHEVAADEALDEPGLREPVHAAALGRMTHPGRREQRQAARLAETRAAFVVRLVEAGQLADDDVWKADTEEAADDDGIAAADQSDGVASRDDLVGRARAPAPQG